MYLPIKSERDTFNQILDESENYYLMGSNETVFLLSKRDQNPITKEFKVITSPGDHYGNVMAGFIDKNERYCVSVGCGYIIYYLHEPFRDWQFHQYIDIQKAQWLEDWNTPDHLRFFEDVRQIDAWEFEIMDEEKQEWEKVRVPKPEDLSRINELLRRSGDYKAIIAGLESRNPLFRFQAICGIVNHQVFDRSIRDHLIELQSDNSRIVGYKISHLATAALKKFGVPYSGDDMTILKLIEAPEWFDRPLTEEEKKAIDKKAKDPDAIVKCPRCGNDLEYFDFVIAFQVKCKNKACIQKSWRG